MCLGLSTAIISRSDFGTNHRGTSQLPWFHPAHISGDAISQCPQHGCWHTPKIPPCQVCRCMHVGARDVFSKYCCLCPSEVPIAPNWFAHEDWIPAVSSWTCRQPKPSMPHCANAGSPCCATAALGITSSIHGCAREAFCVCSTSNASAAASSTSAQQLEVEEKHAEQHPDAY